MDDPFFDIGKMNKKVALFLKQYGYRKVNYNNRNDMIWAMFFTRFGWKFKYNKKNNFPFKVDIDGIILPVKIFNTNKYPDLVKEYNNLLTKSAVKDTFLLVGNWLFDCDDIDNMDFKNLFELNRHADQVKFIGLISCKMINVIHKEDRHSLDESNIQIYDDCESNTDLIQYTERHKSIAYLFKRDNKKYCLGWYYDHFNWIIDLVESTNDNGKTYDCACKPEAYRNLDDDIDNEVEKKWECSVEFIRPGSKHYVNYNYISYVNKYNHVI